MDKTSGRAAVLWWLGWIALTIISFFISCWLWTPIIAKHVGPMDKTGVPLIWITAVFGSWMVLLVPLIVVMYTKVDKAYEDARMTRESKAYLKAKTESGINSVYIEPEKRRLPKEFSERLKKWPETIKRGHLVTVVLNSGERVENVFIKDRKEVLGVYGVDNVSFTAADFKDIEPADTASLPAFEAKGWLRLDGVGAVGEA